MNEGFRPSFTPSGKYEEGNECSQSLSVRLIAVFLTWEVGVGWLQYYCLLWLFSLRPRLTPVGQRSGPSMSVLADYSDKISLEEMAKEMAASSEAYPY